LGGSWSKGRPELAHFIIFSFFNSKS